MGFSRTAWVHTVSRAQQDWTAQYLKECTIPYLGGVRSNSVTYILKTDINVTCSLDLCRTLIRRLLGCLCNFKSKNQNSRSTVTGFKDKGTLADLQEAGASMDPSKSSIALSNTSLLFIPEGINLFA